MRKEIKVIKDALAILGEVDDPVMFAEVENATKAIGEIEKDYKSAYDAKPNS